MTQPVNPFAPAVPQQATPEPPVQHNPAPVNPFAPVNNAGAPQPVQAYAPPAMPAQAPAAPNPFATAAPSPYAPAAQSVAAGQHPIQQAATAAYTPPALDSSAVGAAPPPPPGGGRGADLVAMYGRLVLCIPQHIEMVPRNPKYITEAQRAAGNTTQERMTVTVVVLDDGQGGMQPIAFGGAPHELPPRPHTESAPLPYVRKGMWINQSRLIGQLRPFLPATPGGTPGMTAGRVAKTGPNHNDPWYLITATEQEVALAKQYLDLVKASQYPHPLAP